MVKELYEALLNYWAETKINKHFRGVLKKRPVLGWFFAVLFFGLWLKGPSYNDLTKLVSNMGDEKTDLPALVVAATSESPVSHDETSLNIGGAEYITFTGLWRPSDREAYLQNGSEIFLVNGKEQVSFDHSLPVPFGNAFKLVFALGGDVGGNIQIGRHDAYEITVGDGDFVTVVVRDKDGRLINEIATYKDRNRLENEIIRDVGLEVFLTEEVKDASQFLLKIKIGGNSEMTYLLPLPTKWKEADDFYFALLDYGGTNNTSVYWSEPEIGKYINN